MDHRVRIRLSASLSGQSYRAPGTVVCLSLFGCRVRSKHVFHKNEFVGVLIHVRDCEHPVYISCAEVRWSEGPELGLQFINVELADRRRLSEVIRAVQTAAKHKKLL